MAGTSSPTDGDGPPTPPPIVVITGGTGNLGTKLSHHLLRHDPPKYRVRLIEHPSYFQKQNVHPAAEVTLGDVGDVEAGMEEGNGWAEALDGADALIHFSAVNPYPNADWSESARSMDHSLNVFQAACARGARRIVLATSNHVMGQYKEETTTDLGGGTLRPDMPPRIGTPLRDPAALAASGDATAYAAAKLAGERSAACLAAFHSPRTTFVCLRIGWCQPGENSPSTLSAAGSPPEFQTDTGADEEDKLGDDTVDEMWFRGMWLSNRDFLSYFESALAVDVPLEWKDQSAQERGNPHRHRKRGFLLLNAMSKNSGAKWALDETETHLGIVSQDDSFKPLS